MVPSGRGLWRLKLVLLQCNQPLYQRLELVPQQAEAVLAFGYGAQRVVAVSAFGYGAYRATAILAFK